MSKTKKQHILPKLIVELVPSSCWFSNLRDILSLEEWDIVRNDIYKRNNYVCEICGQKGMEHPVECHEKWAYDDQFKIQKLTGLYSLCPACHEVKHMGLAGIKGRGEIARKHLRKINAWTAQQTKDHVTQAFTTWAERSEHQWKLDLSWLKQQYSIHAVDNRVINGNICDTLYQLNQEHKKFLIQAYLPI